MIQSEAYLIKDTHLRLGSKIHITEYVYAKRLFQKSFYASKFAYIIAKNIFNTLLKEYHENSDLKKHGFNNVELVLIGYAYYSELLVSRTKSILNQFLKLRNISLQINHVIVDNENEVNFNFYFRKTLSNYCQKRKDYSEKDQLSTKKYYSVITPISSTLTTPIKIENEFHQQIIKYCRQNCLARIKGECQICKPFSDTEGISSEFEEICEIDDLTKLFDFHSIPFQTLVVVGNGALNENYQDYSNVRQSSLGFWNDIFFREPLDPSLGRHVITLNKGKDNSHRSNQFYLYIKSNWENIYSCKKCFPENILDESPLFFADKTLVTPDFAYSLPDIDCSSNQEWHSGEPFFLISAEEYDIASIKRKLLSLSIDSKRPVITMDIIKYGHFFGTNKHFYFYFDYLRFFDINSERIKNWAGTVQKKISTITDEIQDTKDNTDGKDKLIKHITPFDKVLLITPNKSASSTFTYMINRYVFNERCNIISFNPFDENINDFKLFFRDWLESHRPHKTIVYYIDNLLTKGNTALKVHDIIKFVRKEKGKVDSEGLAGIFTMIDRLEHFDSFNLIRKFKIPYGDSPFVGIFSFTKINHPVVEAQTAKIDESNCYLCNDLNRYRRIAQSCNLDNIREYINSNNISKRITQSKHEESLRLKPQKDTNKFLRLIVTHELYKSLCDKELRRYFLDSNSSFDEFILLFYNTIINNITIDVLQNKQSNLFLNEIKANVVKTLAENPFIIHRDIKRTIFRWILNELDIELKVFINDVPEKYIVDDSFMFKLHYLRLLFKKTAQLSANYIIRTETLIILFKLSAHEEIIYNKIAEYESKNSSDYQVNKIANFRIFIVASIKESLFNNEPKAIKLEENLKIAYQKFVKEHYDKNNRLNLEPVKRLYESIFLENTGVIRQAYSSWDRYYYDLYMNKEIDSIDLYVHEVERDINKIIDDNKVDNLRRFIFGSRSIDQNIKFSLENESKSFIFSLVCYNILKAYNDELKTNTFQNKTKKLETKVKLLLEILCKILDVNLENGGAFLLLKYQNTELNKIVDRDLVVFGEVGDNTNKLTQYLSDQSNSFTKKMLEGLPFLNNVTNSQYSWTGISALKQDMHWILQSSDNVIFSFDESDFEDKIQESYRRPKRYYFFRVCNWKNENYAGKNTESIPQAVIVFYDNITSDGNTAIEFDITKVRLVLNLKNEISEFIKHNLESDSFKTMIESERIRSVYENRFNRFTHGAKTYLEDLTKYLKSQQLDKGIIFSLGQLVQSHIEVGYLYSQYLSEENKSLFYNISYEYVNLRKEEIHEMIYILTELTRYIYSKNNNFSMDYSQLTEAIKTSIPYIDLKHILLEIICNAFNNTSKNIINILHHNDTLVIKSFGRNVDDKILQRIKSHITSEYPKYSNMGIGLFIINKMFKNSVKKEIEIFREKNWLIVTLPLK